MSAARFWSCSEYAVPPVKRGIVAATLYASPSHAASNANGVGDVRAWRRSTSSPVWIIAASGARARSSYDAPS